MDVCDILSCPLCLGIHCCCNCLMVTDISPDVDFLNKIRKLVCTVTTRKDRNTAISCNCTAFLLLLLAQKVLDEIKRHQKTPAAPSTTVTVTPQKSIAAGSSQVATTTEATATTKSSPSAAVKLPQMFKPQSVTATKPSEEITAKPADTTTTDPPSTEIVPIKESKAAIARRILSAPEPLPLPPSPPPPATETAAATTAAATEPTTTVAATAKPSTTVAATQHCLRRSQRPGPSISLSEDFLWLQTKKRKRL
ncbi:salivary glue protein Sgs-3-like [Schistocerca gregaria]|uniref:salivary glue protein Sgs-3-like n=1 Tax=Schistocerca gregaria TaxID=7010 RepID=UPI00211EFF46|nr:salivary glue protein Sgs-3-like [Schistocerca gregaria]